MKPIVVSCQIVTAFLLGFLFVTLLSQQQSPTPEERMLEQGYGVTGIITSIDTDNSRVTVQSFNTTATNPLEAPVEVTFIVQADSILAAQDFLMTDNTITGLAPKRDLSLSDLNTNTIAFIHFIDTTRGLVVKELLIGEPVPVFNAVTPVLLETLERQRVEESALSSSPSVLP